MFHKTRVKLTAWYLIIIMAISLFFSVFIYVGATGEFDRALRMQEFRREHPEVEFRTLLSNPLEYQTPPVAPDVQVIDEARLRVLESLIGINLIIFILSAFSGYFLAGRTLKPIKEMVDEQNRFITDSSHELRTPLTSLRSEIEVGLRNKKLNLASAQKILASNLEDIISLQTLTERLLELSQNGKLVDNNFIEEVPINLIINEAVKKVETSAKLKQIKIENKVKKEQVRVVRDRLTEVFIILLDNAIKYSSEKNTVSIISKNVDSKIEISVIDNGIGISNDDIGHIFDRFYRANRSRSKVNASGYGLGLSIAKKIVESHKGTISVKSEIIKGSKFTVSLPKA